MPFPRFTKGKRGKLTYQLLNRVFALLDQIEPYVSKLPALFRQRELSLLNTEFDAMVIGYQPYPSVLNQWMYSWVTAIKESVDGYWVPYAQYGNSTMDGDPFHYYATNEWEDTNNGTGEEGFGVVVDPPNATVLIEMLPIPIGMHVRIRVRNCADGSIFHSFAAPNAYKITCKEETAPQQLPPSFASEPPNPYTEQAA